jgi:hypothetical protein
MVYVYRGPNGGKFVNFFVHSGYPLGTQVALYSSTASLKSFFVLASTAALAGLGEEALNICHHVFNVSYVFLQGSSGGHCFSVSLFVLLPGKSITFDGELALLCDWVC